MRKYHQVSDALRSLVPNAKLYVCDEDYDKLEWDESTYKLTNRSYWEFSI